VANIAPADELKFSSMQNLLGMCIENTNEMTTTIKMGFDVKSVMKNIHNKIEEENEREQTNDTNEIINELASSLKEIKDAH